MDKDKILRYLPNGLEVESVHYRNGIEVYRCGNKLYCEDGNYFSPFADNLLLDDFDDVPKPSAEMIEFVKKIKAARLTIA